MGEWDVDSLAQKMPSHLFNRWLSYNELEPFGQPWDNWLMAIQAHQFATAHSKRGQGPKFKDYFYVDPNTKREENTRGFFQFLNRKAGRQNAK